MVDFDKLLLRPCQDRLGEAVLFRPAKGGLFPLRGIFKSDFQAVGVNGETIVQGQEQILGLRRSQLSQQPRRDDVFVIRDMEYVVTEVEPDSAGDLRVRLVKKG